LSTINKCWPAPYLGCYGYAVNAKSSGEEALKFVDQEPLDIVVLEYR
jgi:response regulator RpfG family c-di-GMP phosphodiesterase